MHPRQCIAGIFQMVEFGIKPAIHGVATIAGGRKAKCCMIDDRGLEILLVARIAGCREPGKVAGGGILMALVAFHEGMCAYEREMAMVAPNCIDRDVPSLDGVATLAICAKLAAVNIGMTIGALGAYFLEDEIGMAFRAGDFLVHAAQWITGLIVIEVGIRPDWLPTCISVATLAWNGDWPVRICDLRVRAADL